MESRSTKDVTFRSTPACTRFPVGTIFDNERLYQRAAKRAAANRGDVYTSRTMRGVFDLEQQGVMTSPDARCS